MAQRVFGYRFSEPMFSLRNSHTRTREREREREGGRELQFMLADFRYVAYIYNKR
jgi:hypothetical protein